MLACQTKGNVVAGVYGKGVAVVLGDRNPSVKVCAVQALGRQGIRLLEDRILSVPSPTDEMLRSNMLEDHSAVLA
jgi:hypothetical protein